ncbi:type IV pilus modification protein PilV [Pseudomonas sp. F1_0610]|uniref:type IV pilus modification protein PilV n=1 Tax=Pseudomonas sp. F1_0610 TaxID=3114284 RepID=UPI0039C2F30C
MKAKGFSLIEVLVAIIIVSIGLVGLMLLQAKSIKYTHEITNRNTAVSLIDEMFEILSADKENIFEIYPPIKPFYDDIKTETIYFDRNGKIRFTESECPAFNQPLKGKAQASCWLNRVYEQLPGARELKNEIKICPSFKSGTCAGDDYTGSMVEITLVWQATEKDTCGADNVCRYSARIEL